MSILPASKDIKVILFAVGVIFEDVLGHNKQPEKCNIYQMKIDCLSSLLDYIATVEINTGSDAIAIPLALDKLYKKAIFAEDETLKKMINECFEELHERNMGRI